MMWREVCEARIVEAEHRTRRNDGFHLLSTPRSEPRSVSESSKSPQLNANLSRRQLQIGDRSGQRERVLAVNRGDNPLQWRAFDATGDPLGFLAAAGLVRTEGPMFRVNLAISTR